VERRRGGLETEMQEEIKSIGESLRQRREEMRVSLQAAATATSIRMVYLQALEEGELHKLASPVYAQGFFKQYASFLGLDGESIVRQHPEIFNRPEHQEFAYGIGTLEYRGNPSSGVKWFPNAVWMFLFIGVLLVAWYMARLVGVI
jgi:cytoskeletal protein RodZ